MTLPCLSAVIPVILLASCACQRAAELPAPTSAKPSALSLFLTPKGEVPLRVEIANTPESRAQGLMNRRQLDADAGMVFVFPDESARSFWMKNTYLPLDLIFVTADRHVAGVVARAEPLTLTSRGVEAAAKFVVEANAGFAERFGIQAGTTVRLEQVPDAVE